MADAKPQAKAKAKSSGKELESTGKSANKLRWIVGWLLIPGLVIAGLFSCGVHVGARHPDMFLTRAVLWMTNSEAQRGPQTSDEAAPLGRQLYLMALPKKEFGMSVELSAEQVEALAPDIDPAKLDCKTLCARVWAKQHPDKLLVETHACTASDDETKVGTLECELVVER